MERTFQYRVGIEERIEAPVRMLLPINPADMEDVFSYDLRTGIRNPEMRENQNA